jgi:hypothetical protein
MNLNEGVLKAVVWPVYIGAALEGTTPPFSINEPHNGGYMRGQIHWKPESGTVIGSAEIYCPAGTYTHFVYFMHPTKPIACGVMKMDHPVIFTEPLNVLEVHRICNGDSELAKQL